MGQDSGTKGTRAGVGTAWQRVVGDGLELGLSIVSMKFWLNPILGYVKILYQPGLGLVMRELDRGHVYMVPFCQHNLGIDDNERKTSCG